MKITNAAIETITSIMRKHKLDPKETYLHIGVHNDDLGFSFIRDKMGPVTYYGDLQVILSRNTDADNLVIDLVESGNQKGLIFKGQ
jgi:hypothetical protein